MKQRSERGVALVITLIMLSVITVMAVAFLAITRREKASVANAAEYTDSQHMAEIGLERAKSEIIARILDDTNWTAVDLMVSRNLVNTNGFAPGITNVNYDYAIGGAALNAQQMLQNLTNLWIDPRVPVFINTNRGTQNPPGPLDFRFYVDLNQNGRFDTNGYFMPYDDVGNIEPNAQPAFHVGDLEWIGVLERPHLPHSSSNRFFGRYAFIVVPVGKTLDLNFIHNDAKQMILSAVTSENGFYRNQGFGTWEINLAGFLTHLNTNFWPLPNQTGTRRDYYYETNLFGGNRSSTGEAFEDAAEILKFRYNFNYQNLDSAQDLLPAVISAGFKFDQIDGYGKSLNPGFGGELVNDFDDEAQPWPGASSTPTNHYFNLFSFLARQPPGNQDIREGLALASGGNNSYDRGTFYRLISQLGTDSAAEPEWADLTGLKAKVAANSRGDFPAEPIGRINLNWDNIVDSDPSKRTGPLERHCEPLKFFTNTADVLLRSQFNFGATRIPVYPTNWYTPEVHRMLQLAANLYDSTSPQWYPSVFQPIVTVDPGTTNYYITGFTNYSDISEVTWFLSQNTFGLPMIIGAKKGIPNFNEYLVQTFALAARKLELRRPNTNSLPTQTNQMFVLGVSNYFAVEAWNSYTNAVITNLPVTDLTIVVGNVSGIEITNSEGLYFKTNYAFNAITNIPAQNWPGYVPASFAGGFVMPLSSNIALLTNSAYRSDNPPRFEPIGQNNFDRGQGFHVPQWHMTLSNRMTFILHNEAGRILDFVYLDQITNTVNLTEELMSPSSNPSAGPGFIGNCWNTNRLNNAAPTAYMVPTDGIIQQLRIAAGEDNVSAADWNAFNFGGRSIVDVQAETDLFRDFLKLPKQKYLNSVNTNLDMQTPFNPARKIVQTVSWQADDPLVHHRIEHLKGISNNVSTIFIKPLLGQANVAVNTNSLNDRYRPWNGNPKKPGHPNDNIHAVKDPGVIGSDDWDFPTNKLPNIGWIGRVHRGTPWQTVYLKAEAADPGSWGLQFIDPRSHPTNDWRLIDMFTVSPHPNATRGQLSINQTNIASWSAVLSGVFTLTNLPVEPFLYQYGGIRTNLKDVVIEPGSSNFLAIVDGINRTRALMPDKTFRRLGDILQVPELSIGKRPDASGNLVDVHSLYLVRDADSIKFGLTDVAYERIPQQILSLLKVGDPRYVIYSFGQSLKPADNSIITGGGQYFGMCTNYQITGEVVTRSVVRLENSISRPKAVVEAFNILPID